MPFALIFLFLASPLLAEHIMPDRAARRYNAVEQRKLRVDTYDFSGEYPELENINIDARRKKNVEFILTGEYPALQVVNYEGSFGLLKGEMTGSFPELKQVNFLCSSCAMNLDLSADWKQNCELNIRATDEDIVLKLPKDVGLVIHTKVAMKGKVVPCEGLKKVGRFTFFKKTFINHLVDTAPVVLTLNIEVAEGRIILNQL